MLIRLQLSWCLFNASYPFLLLIKSYKLSSIFAGFNCVCYLRCSIRESYRPGLSSNFEDSFCFLIVRSISSVILVCACCRLSDYLRRSSCCSSKLTLGVFTLVRSVYCANTWYSISGCSGVRYRWSRGLVTIGRSDLSVFRATKSAICVKSCSITYLTSFEVSCGLSYYTEASRPPIITGDFKDCLTVGIILVFLACDSYEWSWILLLVSITDNECITEPTLNWLSRCPLTLSFSSCTDCLQLTRNYRGTGICCTELWLCNGLSFLSFEGTKVMSH